MKIFFDNNVPSKLRRHLTQHQVMTAREKDWHELSNGLLLKQAESAGFALMITGDKNLAYQQNLKERRIALIILGTTHWPTLQGNLAVFHAAIGRVKPGSFEELPTPLRVRPSVRSSS